MSVANDHVGDLTLAQAAAALGVHYMTAYRYVRTGRLAARYDGNQWWVTPAHLESIRSAGQPGRRSAVRPRVGRDYAGDLLGALTTGDEATCWQIAQDALTAGMSPERIYLEAIAPAMAEVGARWTRGEATILQEHLATATATRLIGRLGPLFQRRGRRRGVTVLGAVGGDHHALPTAILADPLRGRGFTVVDLGANVPVESFVEAVRLHSVGRRIVGVGVVASVAPSDPSITEFGAAIQAGISAYGGDVPPMLVGGAGTGPSDVRVGAFDAHSPDYRGAIDWFEAQGQRRRS